MVKISIIIPVYNTASYLKESLDSVLKQSFTDIEMICVNDGSTDNSLKMLESYQSNDDRITIISQENKGLSAARNAAMKKATGEYVLFLDSDDYLEDESLIELYELATSKSLDMILFKIINFDNITYEKSTYPYFEMKFLNNMVEGDVFNWKHVKSRLFDISVTAPGKLFKRSLISNIEFPEGLIFEDNLFFIKTIFNADRVYFHDKYMYNRRLRDDSITNSYFDHYSDCIDIYDMITNYIKSIGKFNEFSTQIFDRKCRDVYHRFSLVEESYKEDFFNKITESFSGDSTFVSSQQKLYDERSLHIYKSALNSETYREFELSVLVFDLKRANGKLKLDNDMLERKYKNQFSQLSDETESYKTEIDDLKNSTSWKITKPLRNIIGFFKR